MPKKNIKDFINKNKTKKNTTDNQPESAKKQEEDITISKQTSNQSNADQPNQDKNNDSPIQRPSKNQNDDSDDGSVEDDADIQTKSNIYGMITENKDDKEENTKIEGYGLEDSSKKQDVKTEEKAPKEKKKTASDITFGGKGRPMKFTKGVRGGTKFAGDFDDGLDNIDDDGASKTKKQEKKNQLSAADGGREFVNLGSTAQARGGPREEEESKQKERAPAQRPRFTGKLNLTKTGDGGEKQQNDGVTTNYGFNVKYKSEHDPKRERKDGEGQDGESKPEVRKDRRHIGGFNKEKHTKQGEDIMSPATDGDDDGFEVVQDKDKARRQQRRTNLYKKESSSEGEDDGFKVTKVPQRGPRKGGAFAGMN